jgi:hypothetical protein
MRVPDIANRNVVATGVNLDICTIDPRALAAWVAAADRIAATLKGDFVIRRDSPWIVDANENAEAAGTWRLAWLDRSLGPCSIGPTSGKQNSERI